VGVRARGHGEGASRLIRLSVNVNKVATIRNSRGGSYPDPLDAARAVVEAGAPGVTVHPRADERHIRPDDVRAIAGMLAPLKGRVEFNIEGDPRADLIALVREVRPDQCTLVPVRPGEVTSQAGWPSETPRGPLAKVIGDLHDWGVRVSLFVDPEPDPIRWAADLGAERIELYTEPYARAWERGPAAARESFDRYASAATLAHELGLGVNAGHDLDLGNLTLFRQLPHLDEVSIGHAIVGRAVFVGLGTVVREYLSVLAAT
jgi:pyridoxine 5-phosphate synthase